MQETTTRQTTIIRPDPEKVMQAIKWYYYEPVSIILLLAWRAGLSRKEIYDLTWHCVDLEMKALRLPDREVPLEEETVTALERWKERWGKQSSYVAFSPRARTHLTRPGMSRLVRNALERFGQTEVNISELRFDYILRQIEEHGLPYALRVSGVSLTTYKNTLAKKLRDAGLDPARNTADRQPARYGEGKEMNRADWEYRLWRIMQKERRTPAGIALILTKQMALTVAEITDLTWADVDFRSGVIRAAGRDAPMTQNVLSALKEEYARRGPDDDPHVILTARSRKPLAADRLSVLIREILIRGGIDDACAVDVRRGVQYERDWETIQDWLRTNEAVTPTAAGELIGVSAATAMNHLRRLEETGYLVHVGRKYYPAERTPPKERIKEEIFGFIAENGTICCAQAETLLGVPSRQIGYILRTMVKEGELDMVSRGRYTFPTARRGADGSENTP